MVNVQKIAPCLWFNNQAEEAVQFYMSIFPNSKLVTIARYGEAGYEFHKKPAGSIITIVFELSEQKFTALNGGSDFKFNEAISFQVYCDTQEDIDYYWENLGKGGDENAQQCGWLKDKFGISWQILPKVLSDMITDPSYEKSENVMEAVLQMKKLDIKKLEDAYNIPSLRGRPR